MAHDRDINIVEICTTFAYLKYHIIVINLKKTCGISSCYVDIFKSGTCVLVMSLVA